MVSTRSSKRPPYSPTSRPTRLAPEAYRLSRNGRMAIQQQSHGTGQSDAQHLAAVFENRQQRIEPRAGLRKRDVEHIDSNRGKDQRRESQRQHPARGPRTAPAPREASPEDAEEHAADHRPDEQLA